ncbi:DUF2188 domain-containing protein [Bacillus thermotolerans]|uniref:DUF2188 domain-containing protein n=1 Tax=Bacillus thermotolerans TaxID=1221996 RepID=UPI0005894C12|nr:DUF2188 domain-containing protein [Bacillus thermotolerans]KKB44045.1 hypothetical protein QY96_03671 [Bacillus thermotolerans]
MNCYSVAPNKDASRWIVKLEDVAPENSYPTKSGAIEAAEELAKENSPSKLEILDEEHQVIEERTY